MTDYIQGPTLGKADYILQHEGAELANAVPFEALSDVPAGKKMVIVVSNGAFEAAAVVEDQRDFTAFLDPSDHRPKTVLFVKDETVNELLAEGRRGPRF